MKLFDLRSLQVRISLYISLGLLLFATLHLARGIGRLHGAVAKHLLVRL